MEGQFTVHVSVIKDGNIKAVEILLKKELFSQDEKNEALVRAAGDYTNIPQSFQIAQKLINAGAQVNAGTGPYKDTPMHEAAASNRVDIMEFLVSKGATIEPRDTNQETPLHRAAWDQKQEAITFLLDINAHNSTGFSPLDKAVLRGLRDNRAPKVIKYIQGRGGRISRVDAGRRLQEYKRAGRI